MNKLKKYFVLMMTVMSFSIVSVNAAPVTLQVGAVDPTVGQGEQPRGPVLVPQVSLEDYTLTFSTPCYGYTLELLDSDGEMVYTTIINSTPLPRWKQHLLLWVRNVLISLVPWRRFADNTRFECIGIQLRKHVSATAFSLSPVRRKPEYL